jgi:hypothetical protein
MRCFKKALLGFVLMGGVFAQAFGNSHLSLEEAVNDLAPRLLSQELTFESPVQPWMMDNFRWGMGRFKTELTQDEKIRTGLQTIVDKAE